jgi:hypothetical protein
MAKLAFTKLGLKTNQDIKIVEFNGQNIEVKQYLPVQDKLTLIGEVIAFSADENNFANPLKLEAYTLFGIIEKYTNITFTNTQKGDPTKLYDMIAGAGLDEIIKQAIPVKELSDLYTGLHQTVNGFYTYRSSVMGILDTLSTDYSNTNLDLSAIKDKITDPETLNILREISPLLNGPKE